MERSAEEQIAELHAADANRSRRPKLVLLLERQILAQHDKSLTPSCTFKGKDSFRCNEARILTTALSTSPAKMKETF